MAKMSHDRLAARNKVSRTQQIEREDVIEPAWLPINFGKYEGARIPELLFRDVGYFYWALSENVFHGWLEHQARTVDSRIRHILPPKLRPSCWEFLIELENGSVFKDFRVVRKKADISTNKTGLIRSKHLDMSIVSRVGWDMNQPRKRMMERIKEEFLPHRKLTRWDFQEFIDTDENFDLTCRATHCPRIPRSS